MNNRAQVVRAMDTIVNCINYEDYIDSWLMGGVAGGDIKPDTTDEEIVEMGYCEDQTFKDLMTLFLKLMYRAGGNGGLYSDGVVSGERYIDWR